MTWKQETIDDIHDLLDSLNDQQIRMLNKLNYDELLDLEKAIRQTKSDSICSVEADLLTKELVRRLPAGPSYDKFALAEIEAHLMQD